MLGKPLGFSLSQLPRYHHLFSNPLPMWCQCRQCRPAGAIGKHLVSRKLVCKNTENSFILCIKHERWKKKKKERKAQTFFFPHTLSSSCRNMTVDRVKRINWSRIGVCASPMTAKERKVVKVVKRFFQRKILFYFLASCFVGWRYMLL